MVDGTPLLDIKPYVPAFDERDEVKVGWFASRLNGLAQARADDRFGHEQRGSAVEPGLEQQ
jgi:tRNA (Thr-GGU) A37 N-methylase